MQQFGEQYIFTLKLLYLSLTPLYLSLIYHVVEDFDCWVALVVAECFLMWLGCYPLLHGQTLSRGPFQLIGEGSAHLKHEPE